MIARRTIITAVKITAYVHINLYIHTSHLHSLIYRSYGIVLLQSTGVRNIRVSPVAQCDARISQLARRLSICNHLGKGGIIELIISSVTISMYMYL